jgi:hypothetical protein
VTINETGALLGKLHRFSLLPAEVRGDVVHDTRPSKAVVQTPHRAGDRVDDNRGGWFGSIRNQPPCEFADLERVLKFSFLSMRAFLT